MSHECGVMDVKETQTKVNRAKEIWDKLIILT